MDGSGGTEWWMGVVGESNGREWWMGVVGGSGGRGRGREWWVAVVGESNRREWWIGVEERRKYSAVLCSLFCFCLFVSFPSAC